MLIYGVGALALTLCMAKSRKIKVMGSILSPALFFSSALNSLFAIPFTASGRVFAACQAAAPLRERRRRGETQGTKAPGVSAAPRSPKWKLHLHHHHSERWAANKNAPAGSMALQMCVTRFVICDSCGDTRPDAPGAAVCNQEKGCLSPPAHGTPCVRR